MNTRLLAAGALALALLAGCGEDTAADYNQRGNDLFAQGQYGQALTQYKEAVLLAPDRVEPLINIGNTRYELQDYLGAIEAPKDALRHPDPAIQAIAYYNQGNAHFRLQEYEQAIGSYKETLRRTPDDVDAKYNLELAQKKLQELQQQQQQANGEGDQQQPQPQPDENGEDQNGQQQPQGPGQDPRPTAPPSSLTPDEAQRELDRLRRAEGRRNEDTYDNYAVGGDPQDGESGKGDPGW